MNGLVDRAVKDWFKDTDKDELFGLRIMAQPSPVPRVLEHPDSPGSPLPMSNQRRLVTPDDDEMLFRGDDSGLPTRQGAISTVRNFHPHLPIDSSYGSRATPPLVRFLKRPLAELSNATSSHGYLGNVPVQTAFKPGDDDNDLKPLSPYVSILRGSGTPKIRGASAGSIPSGESSEAWKEQHAANNARAGSYSSQKVSRAPHVARKSVFREEFDIEYCENLEKHPFDNLEDDNEMLF